MKLAKYIDHTILKADATRADIERLCTEAKEYGFASVCVNSSHAQQVSKLLAGSDVKTCCVVGFPLGAMASSAKAFEAQEAILHGATEIDMVIPIGAMKDQNYDAVYHDIKAVVQACSGRACVKVILETCLLTEEEKVKACVLSVKAGADFVKTSTGFSTGGATIADVELMKKAVDGKAFVKASGGIRTAKDALAMIEAGADRIGTSNGVAIVTGK